MSGRITLNQGNDETRVLWKIEKFLNREDFVIKSDIFRHEYHMLQLCIYPNGETCFDALTPMGLSMKLTVMQSDVGIDPAYDIEYIMGIRKSDLSEIRSENNFSRLNSGVISTPAHVLLKSRSDLRSLNSCYYGPCDITVYCYIRYAKGKRAGNRRSPATSTDEGVSKLSENLKDVYLSQRYTDVKIIVKNKEFHAHKVILCARSEVFAAMFEHDTEEKRSGTVTIKDSDPESFGYFLLYLYTGKLNTVTSVDAVSLYKTADKYRLKELKKECIEYMIKGMTVDSFFDTFHLASLHDESNLLYGATNFFIDNATAIMTMKEWLTLLEEHASLCNELLVKFATRGVQK